MSLQWQLIDFRQYGRIRRYPATGMGSLLAFSFAIVFKSLVEDSQRLRVPWHSRIVQTAVAGLWSQRRSRQPVLACYAVFDWVVKLFITRRTCGCPPGVFEHVRCVPGYMECGQELMPLGPWLRPVVAWEPPSTMVVLWPPGADGATDQWRVVDCGSLLGYSSCPVAECENAFSDGDAHLDHLIVPRCENDVFELDGKEYHFTNRWLRVEGTGWSEA